jgi:hypothetical protein
LLSFVTEFPVNRTCGQAGFIASVKEWILGSPHTAFDEGDLNSIPVAGDYRLNKGQERLRTLIVSSALDEVAAVEYTKTDRDLEWNTAIVFSRQEKDAWIGTRVSCEANHPATRVPTAKKPILIRLLLDTLEGASDGEMLASREPHFLNEMSVGLAARLLDARAGCRLPVVYVSRDFLGEYIVDVNALASDLSGMAHVVVEPSRIFSRRLQVETASENVYGGTIGIYYPQGGRRRSFFVGDELNTPSEVKKAIFEEIRTALINRRALVRCTWSSVQEIASKEAIKSLQATGSIELNKYVEAFDSEIAAKDRKLAEAEREIQRLADENREYEQQFSTGAGLIRLRTGQEQDLYRGELTQIVRDAIEDALTRVQPDSRREHVLKAILTEAPENEGTEKFRRELKELLRGYRRMDSKTRKGLEAMGFSIDKDGGHHKLTFAGDDRYTFTLPTSGSDVRGGLNAATDIGKRVF